MSYNIPAIFVVTRIDSAEEASCKDVTKGITDLCEMYRRKPAFMNDYYKYHSYINGSDLYKKYDLSSKLKNIPTSNYSSIFKDLSLKPTEINDIMTFIDFDKSKINMINETIKGLKMVDGKQNYIPVIYVSNIDGYCLDVVKQSMMYVDPRDFWNKNNNDNTNTIVKFFRKKLNIPDLGLNNEHKGSTFYIDSVYNVKGVGTVVTGINRGNDISINDELFMGPINKTFIKVKVKSIHNNNREDVSKIGDHHRGCLAIKPIKDVIKRNQIPKGAVILSDQSMLKNMCFRFDAAITIFGGHSATLRSGYSPVLHAGTIRQAARLILNDEKLSPQEIKELESLSKKDRKEKLQKKIKSGDVEKVSFKFISRPEYLDPGTVFVFRSGEIHGVGCVIKTYQIDQNDQPDPIKSVKRIKKIRRTDRIVVKSSNGSNDHSAINISTQTNNIK
jgi:GTPase